MSKHIVVLVLLAAVIAVSTAFTITSTRILAKRPFLSMEYVPEGLTKAQYQTLLKMEKDEKERKKKEPRFQSRSFEAWQKAGAVHLFPVDPNTATYEERPYMQRKGGSWEGKDLDALGMKGRGQGKAQKRLELDGFYDKAKKEGRLNSNSIFGGVDLPWTQKAANELNNSKKSNAVGTVGTKAGAAAKKLKQEELEARKKTLAKVSFDNTKKAQQKVKTEPSDAPEKKKGFFGLF